MAENNAPIVEFEVADFEGQQIDVHDDRRAGGTSTVLATVAALDLGEVSSAISGIVDVLAETFRPKVGGVKETEIEFGLAVKADGNLFIAKMGAQVSMKVKVKFDRA